MDFWFEQRELALLDDIMPGSLAHGRENDQSETRDDHQNVDIQLIEQKSL